jgi:phage terminase small subunit
MKNRPLNTRQKRFIENHIIKGMSIAESVRRAGYSIKSGRSEDYSSWGCRLLKTPRVADEARKLREKAFASDCLTFSEKRAFLARAVRADATSPDADLVQEIREEVDTEGRVKRVRKMVSKLEALSLDNRMIGHDFKDREPQNTNPFMLIVAMGSEQFRIANANGNANTITPAVPITLEAKMELIHQAD